MIGSFITGPFITKQRSITRFQALLLVIGFAAMAGCASTADLQQASNDSQRALQAAEDAQAVAEAAQRVAEQALESAQAAQETATSAENCCQVQEERLDRALERMQQK